MKTLTLLLACVVAASAICGVASTAYRIGMTVAIDSIDRDLAVTWQQVRACAAYCGTRQAEVAEISPRDCMCRGGDWIKLP